jgi:hypothetical protein
MIFRFALIAMLLVAGSVRAQESAFTYTGYMQFDPNRVITPQGGRLGDLLVELIGPQAASGQMQITGLIRYDIGTPAGAANGNVAGYPDAIREVVLTLGNLDLAVDIPLIRANAGTSQIGLVALANGGFCADAEHCQMLGVPNAPWGIQGVVINDIPSGLIDETGVTNMTADVFGFMMGRTAAVGEFAPAIQTSSFGVVSVHGFYWGLFARPGGQLVPGLALPSMAQLNGTADIGRSEVWLELEGAAMTEPVRIEGTIGAVNILN